ncbi:MAG: hypothetical protein RL043_947, partial [Pseudomonadota bacterium]
PWLVKELGLTGQRASDPFVRLTGYKEAVMVIGKLEPMPILASDDRKLLANLAAYLPKAQVYAFNPTGLKDNHWQLQRDLGLLAKQWGANAQLPVLLIQTRQIGVDQSGELAELDAIRLEGKSDLGVRASWITAQ